MANDSSEAGYLQPQSLPAPVEDEPLEDFFHDVIQQLAGIDDGDLVRPRWQGEPPTQPDRDVQWISFGITHAPADTYAAEIHDAGAAQEDGSDTMQRHETLHIFMSVYGPNSQATLALIRDSIQIEQNRAVLTQNGMGLQETTEPVHAPLIAKSKWLQRWDMTMIVRRAIERDYSVLNILESDLYLKVQLSSKINP